MYSVLSGEQNNNKDVREMAGNGFYLQSVGLAILHTYVNQPSRMSSPARMLTDDSAYSFMLKFLEEADDIAHDQA